MSLSLRLISIMVIAAIVTASGLAVYSWIFPEEVSRHGKLGGMENFIAAREVKPLPEISFLDEKGGALSLEAFRGKVVVLNLWATWCTPCVAEMPMLDRLQQQVGEVDVEVVALSIDRGGPPVVREFFDRVGVKSLRVYVDPTMRAQSTLGVFGLPTTIIIDRDGNERGRLVGPAEWDDAAAVDLVLGATAPKR